MYAKYGMRATVSSTQNRWMGLQEGDVSAQQQGAATAGAAHSACEPHSADGTHTSAWLPRCDLPGRRTTVQQDPRACCANEEENPQRRLYLLAKQASSMMHSSQKGALMYQGATTSPCSFLRRSSSSHTSLSFSLSALSLSRICAAAAACAAEKCVRQRAK